MPKMTQKYARLRPGDLVEVKSPAEIGETLDHAGAMQQLPFMKEMVDYCGKRFRVSQRALKVCASGMKGGSILRGFKTDDVVLLNDVRCSGADHDGCQKGCVIFWREAWLRKVDSTTESLRVQTAESQQLRARLRSALGDSIYFCQASELLRATQELPGLKRYLMCFKEIRAGNCGVLEMTQRIATFLFWKVRRSILGPYARRNTKTTPTEVLNLQPGELVEVKPMENIHETLDDKASNRGLWFSLCGQQQRVERRIDKLFVDGTGEMHTLRNTVFLEGSFCGCAHIAFGGCSRRERVYWREVWLRRSKGALGKSVHPSEKSSV